MKLELDLSNYPAKADLNTATCVDTTKFAKKVYLANLKSNVDKLDIYKLKNVPANNLSNLKCKVDKLDVDKLVSVPTDLSKLIDVVKNDVAKKDKVEDKTPNITYTTLNPKISEVKKEIPGITNLSVCF